jgi:hypothetical protein
LSRSAVSRSRVSLFKRRAAPQVCVCAPRAPSLWPVCSLFLRAPWGSPARCATIGGTQLAVSCARLLAVCVVWR